jgi:hypothetical protein
MTSSVVKQSWLTAVENASATKEERRLIVETTNWRIIIHDGVTAGGRPQASIADVNNAIASFTAGQAANFLSWLSQT